MQILDLLELQLTLITQVHYHISKNNKNYTNRVKMTKNTVIKRLLKLSN